MAYDDRGLAGIGGWLAFFLISIAILSPLGVIGSTAAQLYGGEGLAPFYGAAWPRIQLGEWVIAALRIAGLWFMAWRLVKVENWQTVRIVIAGLWLIGFLGPLLEMLLVGSTGLADTDSLVGAFAPEFAQPVISSTLWTAYFLRSRRVANTYPREGTHAEVAEIFS